MSLLGFQQRIFFFNRISIQPLYPKLCLSIKDQLKITDQQKSKNDLIDLNASMNTLSCGINLNQEDICMLPPIMSLVI